MLTVGSNIAAVRLHRAHRLEPCALEHNHGRLPRTNQSPGRAAQTQARQLATTQATKRGLYLDGGQAKSTPGNEKENGENA